MNRETEDGFIIHDTDIAFEPVISYLNAEYSAHEPMLVIVKETPPTARLFRTQLACWNYCNDLNDLKREIR